MRAALTLMDIVTRPGFYERLDQRSRDLSERVLEEGRRAGCTVSLSRFGSIWTLFFSPQAPHDMDGTRRQDKRAFSGYFRGMLREGVLFAPSFYEAWFLTDAHTDEDLEATLRAAGRVFPEVAETVAAQGRG